MKCLIMKGIRLHLIISPKDDSKGTKYLKMSADRGNDDAMYGYGLTLLGDKSVPENKKEALRYFKMAAFLAIFF